MVTSLINICVLLVEFMSVHAVGLGCIDCGWTHIAKNVDPYRDRLKMSRIDAEFVAAQMIQRKAIFNGTNQKLIGVTMDLYRDSWRLGKHEVSVVASNRSGPVPATIGLLNFAPKSNLGRIKLRTGVGIAVSLDPHVVHSAVESIFCRRLTTFNAAFVFHAQIIYADPTKASMNTMEAT